MERLCSTPGGIRTILQLNAQIDVTSVLPTIQVPTLVLHRVQTSLSRSNSGGRWPRKSRARAISNIQTATTASGRGYRSAHRRRRGIRHRPPRRRQRRARAVLATVMFTDIVDSTRRLGAWRSALARQLDEHDKLAHRLVEQHRGRLIKTTGDGISGQFRRAGPGHKMRGRFVRRSRGRLGLKLRAGLHTGEVEARGEDIAGIAVNAAARIMGEAGAGEISRVSAL